LYKLKIENRYGRFLGIIALLLYCCYRFPPFVYASPALNVADGSLILQVKVHATVDFQPSGDRARLNGFATDGRSVFIVDSHGARIFKVGVDAADVNAELWLDVSQHLPLNYLHFQPVEGGIRSLAFHPEFESNGKFYTSQLVREDKWLSTPFFVGPSDQKTEFDSVLIEWTIDDAFAPEPHVENIREVLRIAGATAHPIKQIAFNPYIEKGERDYGLLYISHADGALTPESLGGQRLDAFGKILRINPLAFEDKPFQIPSDNPYLDTGHLLETYAIGLRNPHHLSFTQNGNLLIADIGAKNVEEINLISSGANYGWLDREGTYRYLEYQRETGIAPLEPNDQLSQFTYPVAQFLHNPNYGLGIAIAGGYSIENGSPLSDHYLFAEFATSGEIYYIHLDDIEGAVTQGEASVLTQARVYRAKIQFDHDSSDDTAPLNMNNFLQVFQQSPYYPSDTNRADLRFGRGPMNEIYVSSKQNNTIYLITNSVNPQVTNEDQTIHADPTNLTLQITDSQPTKDSVFSVPIPVELSASISANRLSLSWTIDNEEQLGQIDGYNVYIDGEYNATVFDTNFQQMLEHGVRYTYQVSSFVNESREFSPLSAPFVVENISTQGEESQLSVVDFPAPRNLRLDSLNNPTAIAWDMGDSVDRPSKFNIYIDGVYSETVLTSRYVFGPDIVAGQALSAVAIYELASGVLRFSERSGEVEVPVTEQIVFGQSDSVVNTGFVPSNLKVVSTENALLLSWSESRHENGIHGYNIYRNGNFLYTVVGGTTFLDTSPMENNLYSYSVVAISGDRVFSTHSAEQSIFWQ